MRMIAEPTALRDALAPVRQSGERIALVPTMGNLHAGHLALVEAARAAASTVVASIFVNPLQFGPGEDFAAYPRTLDRDRSLLEEYGCDLLFTPEVETMYSEDRSEQTLVRVPVLSEGYCGSSRPGHFDGVATIVCKLFNLCAPDLAFFGLKDYQQFLVIRKMVRDLHIPVQVEGVEIVRAESGLALSSRNNYLDEGNQALAASLYRALLAAREAILSGATDFPAVMSEAAALINAAGMRVDYIDIADSETLRPLTSPQALHEGAGELVILAAAYLGETRLIDNLRFSLPT